MICSQSELKNLIYNSGIGSNIDVGICEEISQAVAKLESFNINASQEALNCFKNPTYRKTKIHVSKNSIGFGDSQVVYNGISAIDNFRCGLYDKITFEKLDSPILLLGLALINKVINFQILFSSEVISYVNDNKFYWNNSFNRNNVKITIQKKKFLPPFYNFSSNQIKIERKIWSELHSISVNALVPKSKESRDNGAGAENDDND